MVKHGIDPCRTAPAGMRNVASSRFGSVNLVRTSCSKKGWTDTSRVNSTCHLKIQWQCSSPGDRSSMAAIHEIGWMTICWIMGKRSFPYCCESGWSVFKMVCTDEVSCMHEESKWINGRTVFSKRYFSSMHSVKHLWICSCLLWIHRMLSVVYEHCRRMHLPSVST